MEYMGDDILMYALASMGDIKENILPISPL